MNELQKQLFTLQDPSYLDFHSKLIPTIEKNRIIGIRTPALRSFAKDFKIFGKRAQCRGADADDSVFFNRWNQFTVKI